MRRQGQWNYSSWHYYVSDGTRFVILTHLQLYLLLRTIQDVWLAGFISRNCRDGEEKFLAACRENVRCRPERSLFTIVSELSPCYWANHKLPVRLFNPYSLPSHMRNKKIIIIIETIRQMAVGGPLAGSRWNSGMTSIINMVAIVQMFQKQFDRS